MPQVQILKYREVGASGQAMLAEMAAKAAEQLQTNPVGGTGHLHVEGVTIGANPFAQWLREQFKQRGYRLDSINWVYWRTFPDEESAEAEMAALGVIRAQMETSPVPEVAAAIKNVQFRVMIEPNPIEGCDEADNY